MCGASGINKVRLCLPLIKKKKGKEEKEKEGGDSNSIYSLNSVTVTFFPPFPCTFKESKLGPY